MYFVRYDFDLGCGGMNFVKIHEKSEKAEFSAKSLYKWQKKTNIFCVLSVALILPSTYECVTSYHSVKSLDCGSSEETPSCYSQLDPSVDLLNPFSSPLPPEAVQKVVGLLLNCFC